MNAPCRSNTARVQLFDDEGRQHEARRVCHECPLIAVCRADTLRLEATGNPVYGVAGGLLPGERPHAMRMDDRKRQGRYVLAEHGTSAAYRRHHRHGEPLCDPCRAAKAQDRNAA